jgi:hypothetical protein
LDNRKDADGTRPEAMNYPKLGRERERAHDQTVAPGYGAGGAPVGVPHSAQNLAVAVRLALQLVQCLAIGVPHESQNLAPVRTWVWQLPHSTVPAGVYAA